MHPGCAQFSPASTEWGLDFPVHLYLRDVCNPTPSVHYPNELKKWKANLE